MVDISPEWVTSSEQGKSSVRVAAFSPLSSVVWDGISSMPNETVIPLYKVVFFCCVRIFHYGYNSGSMLLGTQG